MANRSRHRSRATHQSNWGLLPWLLVLVLALVILQVIFNVRVPHSPLLPR